MTTLNELYREVYSIDIVRDTAERIRKQKEAGTYRPSIFEPYAWWKLPQRLRDLKNNTK